MPGKARGNEAGGAGTGAGGAGDRRDVSSLRGTGKLLRLACEVEHHGRIFVAFTPGPGFRNVIGVLEFKDEIMRQAVSCAII